MVTGDAVLSLAQVASWRSEDRWFSTSEVRKLYLAFRLPEPSNLSRELGRLRDRDLLRTRGSGASIQWALTPVGEDQVANLILDFDYGAIAAELQAIPGALFAHTEYPTLPPTLAPAAWTPGITSFVQRFPFERNVFLMTRFPQTTENDPLGSVIKRLRATVARYGLNLHLASDQQIVDDVWGNVGAHMWACRYGIGILETAVPRPRGGRIEPKFLTLNDNVLIELGSMLTIGRRCMILRDRDAPMPPTDLTSQIFKEASLADLDEVEGYAADWIVKDLRLT